MGDAGHKVTTASVIKDVTKSGSVTLIAASLGGPRRLWAVAKDEKPNDKGESRWLPQHDCTVRHGRGDLIYVIPCIINLESLIRSCTDCLLLLARTALCIRPELFFSRRSAVMGGISFRLTSRASSSKVNHEKENEWKEVKLFVHRLDSPDAFSYRYKAVGRTFSSSV